MQTGALQIDLQGIKHVSVLGLKLKEMTSLTCHFLKNPSIFFNENLTQYGQINFQYALKFSFFYLYWFVS